MIVFAGPPGAGKSVQAGLLQDGYNITWLSMGQLLRDNMTDEIKANLEKGILIDDDTVNSILKQAIDQVPPENRVLLDGFPRKQSQLDWYLNYIETQNRNVEMVVSIVLTKEEAVNRLNLRGRMDDNAKTIEHRYDLYDTEVIPLLKELGAHFPLSEVDGMGTVEEIHERIVKALDGIINVYKS